MRAERPRSVRMAKGHVRLPRRAPDEYATATAEQVMSGLCGWCGVTVLADGLHGRDCHDVPSDRRRS